MVTLKLYRGIKDKSRRNVQKEGGVCKETKKSLKIEMPIARSLRFHYKNKTKE